MIQAAGGRLSLSDQRPERQGSVCLVFACTPCLPDDFPISGFRYCYGTTVLPSLTRGTRLALRPEPDNPHDAFAVEIHHGPAKLGYVPRFCNRHISHLLQNGIPMTCDVERVDPTSSPWESVSVRIHPAHPSEFQSAILFDSNSCQNMRC